MARIIFGYNCVYYCHYRLFVCISGGNSKHHRRISLCRKTRQTFPSAIPIGTDCKKETSGQSIACRQIQWPRKIGGSYIFPLRTHLLSHSLPKSLFGQSAGKSQYGRRIFQIHSQWTFLSLAASRNWTACCCLFYISIPYTPVIWSVSLVSTKQKCEQTTLLL